jgi:hypothetical protein
MSCANSGHCTVLDSTWFMVLDWKDELEDVKGKEWLWGVRVGKKEMGWGVP